MLILTKGKYQQVIEEEELKRVNKITYTLALRCRFVNFLRKLSHDGFPSFIYQNYRLTLKAPPTAAVSYKGQFLYCLRACG